MKIQDCKKVDLDLLQEQAGYHDRMKNKNENENTCIICGKTTKPETQKWVQLSTCGFLTDCDIEINNSQGMFPVGAACYKRFLKALN